ncbi:MULTISPECIES: hypothetical protein [Streptacidiphilus]|uniref:TetR family transcriptional regulator n=1 Tax=Streptacidiphilus cavernicola TaxID=3342716 RepID=A0ABV6UUA0_9ACTN|nr:hypothetical protein [Streptacidiphilus jeojiense]
MTDGAHPVDDRATAADYGAAPEHTFEFGLHAVLDGLAARP